MNTVFAKIKSVAKRVYSSIKRFVLKAVAKIRSISREIWLKITKRSNDDAELTKRFDRSLLQLNEEQHTMKTQNTTQTKKKATPHTMFKKNDKPRSFALSVLFTTLKVIAVIVILAGATGMGLLLGVAKAYIDTTPMLDISRLTSSSKNSYIYDANGELITTFAGMQYREWASIDEIPDMLKNAVVAIEDVRFYKHEGVDYKRLISAVVNTFRNQDTHGGSTITQQLVKNTILTDVQSYKRKIQEAYLAVQLEKITDKDAILEAYLNQVYLGGSNYGVKSAAKDYFGKELNELTIRECAMLAGMIQKPNSFNPRLNTYDRIDPETGENSMWRTNARTDNVLMMMYNAGFITLEQKNAALNDTVTILEHSNKEGVYEMAYFVEYALYDVVTNMLKQRGLLDTKANRNIIETEIRTGGYNIYTTLDTDIQRILEYEVENYDNYPELKKSSASVLEQENPDGSITKIIQPQCAAVIIDHNTGNIVALVGGRDRPEQQKVWNRAYMSALQVGSSIKPIAVYGPALDMGLSPATIAYNIPGRIDGWNTDKGYPSLGDTEIDVVTVRRGVRSSLNVVAARILMEYVGIEKAKEYLIKLGIPEENINADGPGLALGTTGITPIQMTAAFATIANNGVYIQPLSFTKVTDSNGRVILDAATIRETRRVFSESTAYLLADMMKDVVTSGTGTRARIPGMTVAGKTGTNSDYSSVCFSGITPYYASSVWIGHDYPQNVLRNAASGGRYAAPLFKNYMERIHEGLEDKPILDVTPESLGLVRRTVCSVSGLLATDACHADPDHKPITDWFTKENVPKETCNMHIQLPTCTETEQIATPNCPDTVIRSYVLIPSTSPLMRFNLSYIRGIFKNCIFTDEPIDSFTGAGHFCTTHKQQGNPDAALNELIAAARALIAKVEEHIADPDSGLTEEQIRLLNNAISALNSAIDRRNDMAIRLQMQLLINTFLEYTGIDLS